MPSENALWGFQTWYPAEPPEALTARCCDSVGEGWGSLGTLQFSPGVSDVACTLGITVLDHWFSSPGDLVKGQILSRQCWRETWDSAFLTNSMMVRSLDAWGVTQPAPLAAVASFGSLSGTQNLRPHPRSTESELQLKKIPRWFILMLKFAKHCSRRNDLLIREPWLILGNERIRLGSLKWRG